ncbi:MAG: tRNA (N6-isopentenyl adenosine(37)-C2)-methylthiotransferase MiaB [Lachnospiraceae bacterium]|nr:tRNA (N6-isopentenyl adenosine(37)-C2)-methylthiotransferase MiaB [Candidatus Equihabitans merdae]
MNNDTTISQQEILKDNARLIRELAVIKGHPITYHVTTFGCQMNAHDSEKLRGILKESGFVEADEDQADFIIYNTCTIRENADQRVYGRLGYLRGIKKRRPDLKIALCGCMMQEKHVVEKIQKSYRHVDLIFGTHNLNEFPELLNRLYKEEEKRIISVYEDGNADPELMPSVRTYNFKSGVNIMYGCNNLCTYCIVPYVRGRERSREPEDILREIHHLVAEGVKEVMLLGQNVNSYGKNLENPISFAALLSQIAEVEGLERVRFMTSHPKDLSDELIEVMAKYPKICKHLHLPVQSGSTSLLKAMNRHYTREAYLTLVDKLRAAMPDISLTTDIIVGFPGETEEDFQDTMSLVEICGFDSAFTFEYSKRTGTKAAAMENQVAEEVVKNRFARLLDVVQETGRKSSARFEGRVMPVLVEEKNREEGLMTGRTEYNLLVHFPGDESLIGQIVDVSLDESRGFYYVGHQV